MDQKPSAAARPLLKGYVNRFNCGQVLPILILKHPGSQITQNNKQNFNDRKVSILSDEIF